MTSNQKATLSIDAYLREEQNKFNHK